MRLLCLILLSICPLSAQLPFVPEFVTNQLVGAVEKPGIYDFEYVQDYLSYSIRQIGTTKSFMFVVTQCVEEHPNPFSAGGVLLGLIGGSGGSEPCTTLTESQALNLAPVQAVQAMFFAETIDAQRQISYGLIPFAPPPSSSMVAELLPRAANPADPRIIFLDGLGDSIFAYDMTTLAQVAQVPVTYTGGPFGIRPAASGPENEVWVTYAGFYTQVVDLAAQQVITNIPITSVPQASVPAAVVFTNDGATAYEAVRFAAPDASGNKGAVLVFDAVKRQLTSTLLLKTAPGAFLMAPDGLTAYLLDQSGGITYYDVLSGTADLTASTFPPGSNAGYGGAASSQAYMHPDGTRIFWNVGAKLSVFDLTTRKVTQQFDSGLPTTTGRSFTMSQDGARVYFSDLLGDVVVLETQSGIIVASYNTGSGTSVFEGPPAN